MGCCYAFCSECFGDLLACLSGASAGLDFWTVDFVGVEPGSGSGIDDAVWLGSMADLLMLLLLVFFRLLL